MEINKEKIRYILQYHYYKGKNAAQACKKICAIYGEDIKIYQDQITEKSDEILVKVERDKHVSTVEIARELNHLKQFFDQKPQKFYRDGIMALPQKWQNIIENNGAYLV
ncbi:hypothetical protein ALC53_03248 [Atta colombica]|uniref:Mos1 transposase HTH domain-containing protein n=1 Tax=Atta colombica TaxID=520822 RepID=A0A195BQ56_9HYME|nr:hypothetical protein ALC53_03248 [Atta colombica]